MLPGSLAHLRQTFVRKRRQDAERGTLEACAPLTETLAAPSNVIRRKHFRLPVGEG